MGNKGNGDFGAGPGAAATPSLVSFKIFLFFFFAGIGALVPFLPLHMRAAGLTAREARVVSAAAPLVGLLGPLVAAALLQRRRRRPGPGASEDDKLSKKKKKQSVQKEEEEDAAPLQPAEEATPAAEAAEDGKKLRSLLVFTILGAAVCYSALLVLPTVTWYPARRPSVSFSCNASGAAVLQERCMEPACYRWPEQQVGPLFLTHCEYECPDASAVGAGRHRSRTRANDAGAAGVQDALLHDASAAAAAAAGPAPARPAEPPHICVPDGGGAGVRLCHVFTGSGSGITVNASLQQATNPDADQSQWCHYPVAEAFACSLPAPLTAGCRVLCDIEHPYTAEGSVLAQSQCQVLMGDPALTFWSYLGVRCLADAFPTAALVLVDTALVVATRERHPGPGLGPGQARKPDLGRQLAVGLLGTALAAPLAGYFSPYPTSDAPTLGWPPYGVPILAFTACMILAALVLVCSPSMPVGAGGEWWSAARPSAKTPARSGCEAAALFLVLALLGAFCSAIDSYLPWHVSGLQHVDAAVDVGLGAWGATPELLLGLNVLVGVLPAAPLLWRAEALVRYCGSSNLLITAFTFYIIRYAGLSLMWSPWWILLLEATEVFTLSIMWVTAVLYFAALLPRRLLAAGQALCVAAHFGVGRSLGALLGGLLARDARPPDDEQDTAPPDDPELQQLRPLYAAGAGAAAIVAVLYFLLYHCCLARAAGAGSKKKARALLADRSVLAGQNVNGSYTPLRVYHNGHGRRTPQPASAD